MAALLGAPGPVVTPVGAVGAGLGGAPASVAEAPGLARGVGGTQVRALLPVHCPWHVHTLHSIRNVVTYLR